MITPEPHSRENRLERATLRVGDVFLKIDADQTRADVEVEAMALAPIPTPEAAGIPIWLHRQSVQVNGDIPRRLASRVAT